MNRAFSVWLGSFLAVAVFTLISVWWLDKPIALFVHGVVRRQISGEVANARILSPVLLSALVFIMCGLLAMSGRLFSKLGTAILLCDISALAANTIKDQLKFAFGRTWPDNWVPSAPSFIHDNVYGFHFFQSGASFKSFPSGHAAALAAVLSVLWIFFPKLQSWCALCVIVADTGLVLLNIHFLSDVVAGTFVGVSAGMFTIAVWRASSHLSASAPGRQIGWA